MIRIGSDTGLNKFIYKVFVCVFILLAFTGNMRITKAATTTAVEFKSGMILFKTIDTAASSPITWETAGFTITRMKCIKGPEANGGYPDKMDHAEIILKDGWKQEKLAGGGKKEVIFTIPKDAVDKALINGGFDGIKPNDTLYLHGIFQVMHGGKRYGTRIFSLPDIMSAERWRNPNDFQDRFDIPVIYQSAVKEPVSVEYRTLSGAIIEKRLLARSQWAGLGEEIAYSFEDEKSYRGKTYELNKSFIRYYSTGRPVGSTGYSPAAGYSKTRIQNRLIKQKNGGVEFVAIMKMKDMPPDINSSQIKGVLYEPDPYGIIGAMDRGREKYDITKGIPSSEELYVNVVTGQYLLGYRFRKVTGRKTYPVTVRRTYILKWKEQNRDRQETKTINTMIPVDRSYEYWLIDNIDFFQIDKAVIQNYGLPDGEITIYPENYTVPPIIYEHTEREEEHIREPKFPNQVILTPQVINSVNKKPDIPEVNYSVYAESKIGKIQVRNDFMEFDGKVVMAGGWKDEKTLKPDILKTEAGNISDSTLYRQALKIAANKLNGTYDTKGYIYYKRSAAVNPGYESSLTFEIRNLHPVTIHTPVICNTAVSNMLFYNQMIFPDKSKASLVLDREFSISFPTLGEHGYMDGYGYRDYGKYIKRRMVKFPFAVYKEQDYIPAEKWIVIDRDITRFSLPAWVDEGAYRIHCKAFAVNAFDENQDREEAIANLETDHYIATDSIDVEVSGRLYGLKLYDVSDYPLWRKVFRQPDSLKRTGFYYSAGINNCNGIPSGQKSRYTFPLYKDSHPLFRNSGGVKPGYAVRFEVTTIGNMSAAGDYVRILPHFYYFDEDSGSRYEVDCYYDETFEGRKQKLVRMGSEMDRKNIKSLSIEDPFLAVPQMEIEQKRIVENWNKDKKGSAESKVYTFTNIMIPQALRTYTGRGASSEIGAPAGIDPIKIIKSRQKWYCEYYIPSNIHIVRKGFDVSGYAAVSRIDFHEDFWLTGGCLVLNFDIETIQNGKRHLSYSNRENSVYGYCNMWKMEGFSDKKTDGSGTPYNVKEGDFIIYDTMGSAAIDYRNGGTH